ncbi:MAG TPA: MipA/OmpV family protein, partial [Cellvibrionaceae bacterium]|nr:MipA/OmpV family protein [Cellvibrionaceae bacterium]
DFIKGEGAAESTGDKPPHLHHRHTSALGGFEYNASLGGFFDGLEFNWQFLEELSGYHAGREMRLAISRDFLTYWRASLGANFQSRDYINYYFGVSASEASPLFSRYTPNSGGWSKLVRVEYLKPLSPHLAIKGGAALKIFSSAVADSPLLEESSVYSLFLGGVYYF